MKIIVGKDGVGVMLVGGPHTCKFEHAQTLPEKHISSIKHDDDKVTLVTDLKDGFGDFVEVKILFNSEMEARAFVANIKN